MLQGQIVKDLGNQIDIEGPDGMKYAITSFHSIAWLLISVNVTIYSTAFAQWYETSHSLMVTTNLRSSI
jgi:hypothetical protein